MFCSGAHEVNWVNDNSVYITEQKCGLEFHTFCFVNNFSTLCSR